MLQFVLGVLLLLAQQSTPAESSKPAEKPPPPEQTPVKDKRTELNLLGATDAAAGESRRNENVQFNLVDNNALKELNIRLGATATIVQEVRPERGYFSAEFGNPPSPVLHVPAFRGGLHGDFWETHQNSICGGKVIMSPLSKGEMSS